MKAALTQMEQHSIQVQRLATRLLNANVYPSLTAAYKAARSILLDAETITSITQLNKITREINRVVASSMSAGWDAATVEMEDFATYEAGYYANVLATTSGIAMTTPLDSKITSAINKTLMSLESGKNITSGTWAQLIQKNTTAMAAAYDSAVRTSFSKGETGAQAAKRIAAVTEGLSKNDATILARTGVQHYATQARQAMAKENISVIDREYPSTVFDNRRTIICTSIQDKYGLKGWPVGESPIGYPPYHYGCRTEIIHSVKGQDSLSGMRSSIGSQSGSDAEEAYELRKKRMQSTGKVKRRGVKDDSFFDPSQIRASTPTDKWLSRQSEWFIEESLGVSRAALFTKGGMSLSSFTDLSLRPLTLAQLRAVDAKAFELAGL